MIRNGLIRWLKASPLTGRLALLCGLVAILLGTLIREGIDGDVTGCEFTPYLPFVLVSAILLRWWQAGLVALASVAALGGLFMGPPAELLGSHCFLSSSGIFLASSAAMIGFVCLVRGLTLSLHVPGADESAGGIVFSLKEGEVWASWYGQGPPVLLGSQAKVTAMMEDFLGQVRVAKWLNRNRQESAEPVGSDAHG